MSYKKKLTLKYVFNLVVSNNAGFKQAYTNEFDNQRGLVGEIHLTYLVVRVWLSVLSIRDWLHEDCIIPG